MSSGYGVDKPRVEEHPHRQVPRERFTPSLTQFGGTPSVGGLFEDMRTNTGPVNRNSGYVPSMGWGTQRAPRPPPTSRPAPRAAGSRSRSTVAATPWAASLIATTAVVTTAAFGNHASRWYRQEEGRHMPSGHGVDKPRVEEHPNRKVGRENWQPSGTISGPMGQVAAHVNPGGKTSPYMASWQGSGGYRAEVEMYDTAYPGDAGRTYIAGPFRTQARSQIAAESLALRVENDGDTKRYRA